MSDYLANKDIDLSFLYDIADGSDEFIIDSINMFLDQSPEILRSVGDAIAAKDWPNAALAAHKIKANLGFFGMLNSQAIIQEIELACKAANPDVDGVTAKFNEVKSIIGDNMIALKQIKAEKENGI